MNPLHSEIPIHLQPPIITPGNSGGCSKADGCCGGCEQATVPPEPGQDVLSTLHADGTRRWLRPSLAKGRWWRRRRIVAYALIVIFVAIPHIRIGGDPLLLLDITQREFIIFGHTFLPTDTLLLALLMVGVFLSIFFMTALAGRVWCGWGCPQTVYMEFLFRPIDRLFEGTTGRGGRPRSEMSIPRRIGRWAVYLVLSMLLAHTFLAYFVGTERLATWIQSSPIEHPMAFLVMAGTTAAMLFDFLFFREQLCVIACPYGRFQSALLDRSSLIVGYDPARGEPRRKGRRREGDTAGDCIDCGRCVAVCPTGIDIRNGLQMECINCTQCIDACDDVMRKINKPPGLIRYSSQDSLAGKPTGLLRPRTLVYPLLLAVIGTAFGLSLGAKYEFDARLLRGHGVPFNRTDDGGVLNTLRLRLVNRTDDPQTYDVSVVQPPGVTVQPVDEDAMTLEPGETVIAPLTVRFPSSITAVGGVAEAELRVTDTVGNERILEYRLLGPRR